MKGNDALVEKLVHSVRLFTGFDHDDVRTFLTVCTLQHHTAGMRLITEGETSYDMYVMLSGEVAVLRRAGVKETELARLGPGDTFGELALLDFGKRSASIDVLSETRVFVASRAAIFRLSGLEAKLYRNLAIMMATRLRKTDDILGKMAAEAEMRRASQFLSSSTQQLFVG